MLQWKKRTITNIIQAEYTTQSFKTLVAKFICLCQWKIYSLNVYFTFRHMDNNKLHFIPAGSLDFVPKLETLKLGKNPWHCDCSILYLAM